jgi:hypothetical protein
MAIMDFKIFRDKEVLSAGDLNGLYTRMMKIFFGVSASNCLICTGREPADVFALEKDNDAEVLHLRNLCAFNENGVPFFVKDQKIPIENEQRQDLKSTLFLTVHDKNANENANENVPKWGEENQGIEGAHLKLARYIREDQSCRLELIPCPYSWRDWKHIANNTLFKEQFGTIFMALHNSLKSRAEMSAGGQDVDSRLRLHTACSLLLEMEDHVPVASWSEKAFRWGKELGNGLKNVPSSQGANEAIGWLTDFKDFLGEAQNVAPPPQGDYVEQNYQFQLNNGFCHQFNVGERIQQEQRIKLPRSDHFYIAHDKIPPEEVNAAGWDFLLGNGRIKSFSSPEELIICIDNNANGNHDPQLNDGTPVFYDVQQLFLLSVEDVTMRIEIVQ